MSPHHDPTEFPEPTYQEATEGWQNCQVRCADLERELGEARERGITLYRMVESRLGWDSKGYQLVYCGYPTCMGGNQGETQELLDATEAERDEAQAHLRESEAAQAGMRAALEAVQREQDAEMGTPKPCLFCYEAEHVEDCPGPMVEAALSSPSGLQDALKAGYEALRVSLNKGRWLVALLARTTMVGEDLMDGRPSCVECNRWLDTEGHHEGCHYQAGVVWLRSSRAALELLEPYIGGRA